MLVPCRDKLASNFANQTGLVMVSKQAFVPFQWLEAMGLRVGFQEKRLLNAVGNSPTRFLQFFAL